MGLFCLGIVGLVGICVVRRLWGCGKVCLWCRYMWNLDVVFVRVAFFGLSYFVCGFLFVFVKFRV